MKEQLCVLQMHGLRRKEQLTCHSLSGLQQDVAAVFVKTCLDYDRKQKLYM